MKEQNFTAIDFETANGDRNSICLVGIVRVENGIIKDQLSILVQPPNNFYWDNFIDIHGITPKQTENAPTFNVVWKQIEHFIKGQNLVAHNGFSFDFPCLNQTLEYYNIQPPKYTKHCTYKLFNKKLSTLCKEYKIPLNHHDALSDAMACASLFKIHLNMPLKNKKIKTDLPPQNTTNNTNFSKFFKTIGNELDGGEKEGN